MQTKSKQAQANPSERYKQLTTLSNAELEILMRTGARPAEESLAGHQFRGFNTPAFASLLGIQKFVKGFLKEGPGVEGYNIAVRRNEREVPWITKPSAESPKRFGYYDVYPVRKEERDNFYPNALLLNYGTSKRNHFYQVERLLRDYLVLPDAGNPDLILGKAYLALGPLRVPVSFFVLEKL
jgi:hypothetical protein